MCEWMRKFRYRFQDGRVVLFDQLLLPLLMDEGKNCLKWLTYPWKDSPVEEYVTAEETVSTQKEYFTTGPMKWPFSVLRYALISLPMFPILIPGTTKQLPALFDWEIIFERDGKMIYLFPYRYIFLCIGRHSYSQICGLASGLPEWNR